VIVTVSLYHQHRDKFGGKKQENGKRTGAVSDVWYFIDLLSSGTPCIAVDFALPRARRQCPPSAFFLLNRQFRLTLLFFFLRDFTCIGAVAAAALQPPV
jgi:hypothetical protein